MFSQADAIVIYIYKITMRMKKDSKKDSENELDAEISQYKFVGITLWIIAYFVALIFQGKIELMICLVIYYGLSLAENIILKTKGLF